MRFFVLGANGNTGMQFTDLALAKGHQVTAFVRSPEKISCKDKGLTVLKGDPGNIGSLAEAIKDHDVVISTLGTGGFAALKPHDLLERMTPCVVAAMEKTGVKRIFFVSVGLLFEGEGFPFNLFRLILRNNNEDSRMGEKALTESSLDWTIVRPAKLVKSQDESYHSLEGEMPPKAWSMSFRAVAKFMLDSAEKQLHSRKVVGLAS
jgi:putative NADH-flavin reductase